MKKFIALLAAACLSASIAAMPATAVVDEWFPVGTADEVPIADTAKMTDEDFLGVWKDGQWIVESKLDYDYAPTSDPNYKPLSAVGEFVKQGDYEAAKKELLAYFRNKRIDKIDVGARNTIAANFALDWTFVFRDNYFTTFSVNTTPGEVQIDVTDLVQISRENFMLFAKTKANSTAYFASKEDKNGKGPVMEVVVNGEKRTYQAAADTYLLYGDRDGVFGTQDVMKVRDSGIDMGRAFDNDNCRAYLRFAMFSSQDESMRIKEDDVVSSAVLKLYGWTDDESGRKQVMLFDPETKNFDENTMSWNNTSVCTISWNGVPGGTDWKQHVPDYNAHAELTNVQTRMAFILQMIAEYNATYDERYMRGVFGLLTDFGADWNGPGYMRPFEAAERCNVYTVSYPYLLESSYMTPDFNIMLLKLMWLDADYLSEDQNFWSFNNHGVVQTKGFMKTAVRMPEFKDVSEKWLPLIEERIDVLTDLVLEDGYYIESDTGYASTVMTQFQEFGELSDQIGMALGDRFYDQLGLLALSLLDSCWPNGILQSFGDGGTGDMRGAFLTLGEMYTNLDNEKYQNWGNQFLYFATGGTVGTPVEHQSYYYDKGRIAIMRRGWNESDSLFAFINGGHRGGHNHRDKLNIDIFAYGRPLIKETGMASYSTLNSAYDFQKNQSRSHNVVEIDDYRAWDGALDKMNETTTSKMSTNSLYDFFEGETDANRLKTSVGSKFITKRNILFVKPLGFWIVSDHITPPDEAEHKYTQNWHMEPMIASIKDDGTKRAVSNFSSGANIQLVPGDAGAVEAELREGYGMVGNSQPLATVDNFPAFTVRKQGMANFDTILFPTKEGDKREIRTTPVSTGVDSTVASAFSFDLNYPKKGESGVYYISHEASTRSRSFDNYTTDARMASVIMESNGTIANLFMQNGAMLTQKQEDGTELPLIQCDEAVNDIGVSIYGSTMEIASSSDFDPNETDIVIYTPNQIKTVLYNGKNVKFSFSGNQVKLFGREDKITVSYNNVTDKNEGYIGNGGMNRSVTSGKVTFDVALQPLSKLSASTAWDGTLSVTADNGRNSAGLLVGNAKESISTDKVICIRITADKIKNISMNGVALPTTDYASLEEAQTRLKDGEACAVFTKSGAIIYSRVLTEFFVQLADSSGSGGGSGGSSGGNPGGGTHGGSGSGSGTGPDGTVTPPVETEKKTFEDIKNHWAKADIENLLEKGLVTGVTETEFLPERPVSRAELTAMIVRALGKSPVQYRGEFRDVSGSAWYAPYVQTGYDLGLVSGFDGLFRPEEQVTREEAAKILVCAYRNVQGETADVEETAFADQEAFSPWAVPYIEEAVSLGLLKGKNDNCFDPAAQTTRAEAAVVISRLLAIL